VRGTDELVWHFDVLCLKKEIKILPVRFCVVVCKKCFMKLKTSKVKN